MKFINVKFVFVIIAFIIALQWEVDCKRGGRRGGVYKGSSNVWGRSRQSHGGGYDTHRRKQKTGGSEEPKVDSPTEYKKLETPKKASAPPAPAPKQASQSMIDQERKQGATNQRPIGWDVNGQQKPAVGGGDVMKKQSSSVNQANPGQNPSTNTQGQSYGQPPPHGQAPPPYTPHGQAPPPYTQHGQAPPPYTPHGQPPPPYAPHGQTPAHGYGQPPPPYSHGAPPPYYQPQGYPQGMGGYGGHFGGSGYGMGGMGGFGGGGYGGGFMKPSTGFGSGFAKHAVRNIVGGLLIWHLVSGLTRRPYEVHNYYNRPDDIPREMSLPANVITVCPEKVSELCAPNTIPLCTSNNTIMCAVDADKTTPCQGNLTGINCIASTPPCDEADGHCGPVKQEADQGINIPCIANATIDGKVEINVAPGVLNKTGGGTVLCITTFAMPRAEDSDPCSGNGTSSCIPLDQTPPPPLELTTKEPILNAKIIIPPPTSTISSSSVKEIE